MNLHPINCCKQQEQLWPSLYLFLSKSAHSILMDFYLTQKLKSYVSQKKKKKAQVIRTQLSHFFHSYDPCLTPLLQSSHSCSIFIRNSCTAKAGLYIIRCNFDMNFNPYLWTCILFKVPKFVQGGCLLSMTNPHIQVQIQRKPVWTYGMATCIKPGTKEHQTKCSHHQDTYS